MKKKNFKVPTNKEIAEYLKQTKGIVDNELLNFLGLKSHVKREIFWYHGNLSLQQRVYIFQTLNED